MGKNRDLANKVLPRLLATDAQGWMFQTTLDNLELIQKQQTEDDYKAFIQTCIDQIKKIT